MTCSHRADAGMPGMCARCEDAAHEAAHPQPVDGCFACKVTRIQWSPAATPSTRNTNPPKPSDNAWEKGIVTQDRPGGTVMPILDKNLEPMPIKDLSTKRHEIQDGLRRLHQAS
jgi:hypothetical protein